MRVIFAGAQGILLSPAVTIDATPVVLGRSTPLAELFSLKADASLSRAHAHLERRGKEITVTDGGSRNGTFVNAARVGRAILRDGDLIRVGECLLLFRDQVPKERDVEIPALLGRAPAMRLLRHRIALAAPTPASIFLLGESGVGKTLSAQVIHDRSLRAGRFVSVKCAAIPESLAESQLFGHVAGAFTGAQRGQEGLFRAAHNGTLFLDEVTELPLAVQSKLLSVLEDRTVTPVGSNERLRVDVRVIAATNVAIHEAIEHRKFRGDLFARLNGISIEVPPLRERREDVLPLFVAALGEPALSLSCALAEALVLHRWTFNVRELAKVAFDLRIRVGVEHTSTLAPRIELGMLDDRLAGPQRAPDAPRMLVENETPTGRRTATPSREALAQLLSEHDGVITAVAEAVGRSRKQVYRWIEHYGLTNTRWRDR